MFFLKRDSLRVLLPVLALAIGAFALVLRQAPGRDDTVAAAASGPVAAHGVAPAIVVTGASIRVGTNYQVTPSVADAHGDALTFTADNLPPWASIDARSGTISGTPGAADIGEYESITVTMAAADGSRRFTSEPFAITVVGPPAARLAWPRPVMRVDGSNLDDLAGYRIVYGRNPDDLDHSIFIADPDQVTYEFNTLEKGAWYFAVIALTADGLEGPSTVPAMKVI